MPFRSLNPARVARYALIGLSIASFAFGIVLSLGWQPTFRIGRALRVSPRRPLSPAWPVLIALGSAAVLGLSMSAWGARVAAFVRSGAGAIWLASLAIAGLLVVFVLPDYLQSAPQAYPVSDGAVIELYTLHAIRKFWYTGPYSQFGWHHPGPLLFYLLAPFYALSNLRTFGLRVGAFAINLASLLTIVLLLLRRATPGVASIGIVGVGIYVFRLTPLAASYWNPHIVAFPVGALLVLCARLASGRLNTLPAVVFVGTLDRQSACA